VEEPVTQTEPFLAKSADPAGDAPEQVKELTGEAFTLDASYAPPPAPPRDPDAPPPLELEVLSPGAITDPIQATLTIVIKNPAPPVAGGAVARRDHRSHPGHADDRDQEPRPPRPPPLLPAGARHLRGDRPAGLGHLQRVPGRSRARATGLRLHRRGRDDARRQPPAGDVPARALRSVGALPDPCPPRRPGVGRGARHRRLRRSGDLPQARAAPRTRRKAASDVAPPDRPGRALIQRSPVSPALSRPPESARLRLTGRRSPPARPAPPSRPERGGRWDRAGARARGRAVPRAADPGEPPRCRG